MESGGDISGGRNYLQAALDALHLAGSVSLDSLREVVLTKLSRYLEIYSIDGLCTLLLLHRYYTEQDSASATAILDIAIRTAQGLGLVRLSYQRPDGDADIAMYAEPRSLAVSTIQIGRSGRSPSTLGDSCLARLDRQPRTDVLLLSISVRHSGQPRSSFSSVIPDEDGFAVAVKRSRSRYHRLWRHLQLPLDSYTGVVHGVQSADRIGSSTNHGSSVRNSIRAFLGYRRRTQCGAQSARRLATGVVRFRVGEWSGQEIAGGDFHDRFYEDSHAFAVAASVYTSTSSIVRLLLLVNVRY